MTTTEPTHDLARWKVAGDRLHDVLRAVMNMRGMPGALAGDAVENADYILAPLKAMDAVPLPEQVKEAGRAVHSAAKGLADDPTRTIAERWVNALQGLRSAMAVHGTAVRDACRKAVPGPPIKKTTEDISSGRMARREQEKISIRFTTQGGG